MTAIKITKFGGLAPSVDPRNLPEEGAQVAHNLDLRFGDFRPTKGLGDSVATVPAGTKSIFKTPSGVWLSSTTDTDYVVGPINDAAVERVYLTGRSAYPEAWQGGEYRRLGVPVPMSSSAKAKPTVTVNATDQYDSTDATADQETALLDCAEAVTDAATQIWLGNDTPAAEVSAGPVAAVAGDPLFSDVALLFRFEEMDGAFLLNSGPDSNLIGRTDGNTTITTGTPMVTGGGKYAAFSGGGGAYGGGVTLGRRGASADWFLDSGMRPWTFETLLNPDETLEFIVIQARSGGGGFNWFASTVFDQILWGGSGDPPAVRKIAAHTTSGQWRTLATNGYSNMGDIILKCRRPDASPACPAGVVTHLAVVCDGPTVKVFLNGVLCGTHSGGAQLEVTTLFRATNADNEHYRGAADELRITFAARYTADFTPPVSAHLGAATPAVSGGLGVFLAHGDSRCTGLPTTDDGDAVFAAPMVLSGGAYVMADSIYEYLRGPAFAGAQITFGGLPYWAVLIKDWKGSGLTTTHAAVKAALLTVDNPADTTPPIDKLLTPTQADELATVSMTLWGPDGASVIPYVNALNAAQAALVAQAAKTSTTASELASKIAAVHSATVALEGHFANVETVLQQYFRANAGDIFGNITASVVQRTIETRTYVVTYVSDWDEESAPTAASDLVELDQNDTATVTRPAPVADRHVVGWRLYRSSTTNTGAAWQLVDGTGKPGAVMKNGAFAYFDINAGSLLDTAKQEELQETLQTTTWAEPPENLKGLVGLPNGIMAGFFDKTLCFSEPYQPYAWPIEYQHSLKYRIVGLGVFGQTVVVLTEGHPYYASGADSASMSVQELENPQSCVAKRTIVPVEGGVMFASPDGLCLASPSGVEVLTYAAFSKEDWAQLATSTSFGAHCDGSYYLFPGE